MPQRRASERKVKMRLNKATSHAIKMLVACARADSEFTKVAALAEQLDLTLQNTFKIAHLLSRAGLVRAMRGRYGGVRLAEPAENLLIGDVVLAMEKATRQGSQEAVSAAVEQLPLLDAAFEAFIAVLNQSTIADLAKTVEPAPKSKQTKKPTKKRATKVAKTRAAAAPRRTSAAKY